MPCFHPLQAYYGERKSNGKFNIVFNSRDSVHDHEVKLPCGQCVGCRLERSRQWAIRCVHEAQLHSSNCFITLTFSPEHLPENRSLDVRFFQLFMKRLRKRFGNGIRFFHCGEYGEKYGRPHYHACIFGLDFPDKVLFKSDRGINLYTSVTLNELWPYGFSSIGDVTFESAAYVARYIMKKINGKDAKSHYEYIDCDSGEVFDRKPEYTTMSRRPGIGKPWFDKYMTDVFPSDFVIMRGAKMRPPKYYDTLFEVRYPYDFMDVKEAREASADDYRFDNTPERLSVREKVQLAKLKMLVRNVDKDV